MNEVLLFTTPTVEGMPIEQYFGIVTANQVAGTGFFTDFVASFSDFFGGNSGAYRDSMNALCYNVTKRIKKKAADLGANAVIGIKLDYDSISAKNMSMFMVSIQGTAVKLNMPEKEVISEVDNSITWEALNVAYQKKKIKYLIESDSYLRDEDWEFILKGRYPDLGELLYKYYIKCLGNSDPSIAFNPTQLQVLTPNVSHGITGFAKYLSTLEYEDAIKFAYRNIVAFKTVIEQKKLFNANKILEIAKLGDLSTAISLLKIEKASYNDKDLEEMKALSSYFQNLPDQGHKEDVKGGLFSSGGVKYVCTCGYKNELDYTYCKSCGKDVKGLRMEERKLVNNFAIWVDTLAEMFDSGKTSISVSDL
jgi:uncharacterized protein YbjQ (UPF0145 family)